MTLKYHQSLCKCSHKIGIEIDSEVAFVRIKCKVCSNMFFFQIGQYQIVKHLGTGGMGSVFLATNAQEQKVALKLLEKPEQSMLDHFLRECMVQMELQHKNIARLYGQGSYEDTYYLAMEYVEGKSLTAWLKKRGVFTPREAVKIILSVLSGLRYAAEANVIHRDIKPGNIILTNSGEVKILDLGLAKTMGETYGITADDDMKGSPSYMPYEQFLDAKNVDARADVYAVGATLYQLLCGTRPFEEYKLPQLVPAKQKDQYIRLQERKDGLSQELLDVVEKAMALAPENRYSSAGEMLETLFKIYPTLEK